MKVDAVTLPGGSRNQDAFAVLEEAVIVLDGASIYPANDPDRDGGWYARTLLDSIRGRLQLGGDLTDCLADAIATVRDQYSLTPGGPSSTVLLARTRADAVDLLALGDSTLVIERADHSLEVLTDDRLATVGTAERRAYRDRLLAGGGFDTEHTRLLGRLQERQRTARNLDGGYWVAESEPDAARHAITRTLPLSAVRGLLLLTDGAAAGVARYAQPADWPNLLRRLDRTGIASYFDALHHVEEADPTGQRWPRAKVHDDKTAARLRL